MKLMLISLAPCEIMRTLMWRMALKTWAAMPFWPRMSSPTMQTSAFLPSYFTSASWLEVGGDGGQLVVGVDGERDGDFAGGNHVDRALVLVEDGEDLLQVAVGHEHAAGHDVDDAELLFDGDGLEGALAVRRERDDARAFAGGVAAVEHEHGNVLFDGGQDGGRVQNLGAEVGQFGCFFKADDLDAQRIGADARVGGHDAVHVGPDFDGLGRERAADERAGEVGAAAAEGGGDAGLVGGDEAAHDGDLALRR